MGLPKLVRRLPTVAVVSFCFVASTRVYFRAKPRNLWRLLSTNLGGGNCLWAPPEPIPLSTPLYSTLIVGYPGSGKRLLWQIIEALTGGFAGDDWDLSEHGKHVVSMKTSYPHFEGVWDWGASMDQAILMIRNPRYALPSYLTIKHELGYSESYETSYLRKDFVYTETPDPAEWMRWRDANFEQELKRWQGVIDFWMQNGVTNDSDGNPMQDPNCGTNLIDCRPKVVISYERLNDPRTGHAEVAKLADILDDHPDVPIIEPEARACVYDETINNSQPGFKNNNHRSGKSGPGSTAMGYTMVQLLDLKKLFFDTKEKYSREDLGWGSINSKAQVIVDAMDEYMTDVCMEIINMRFQSF